MSSTQWENRNRGFIPPSELRQQSAPSPSHDFSVQPNRPVSVAGSSPLRPAPTPTASSSTHNRSSSFFSFRSKSSTSVAQSPPPTKLMRTTSPSTLRKDQKKPQPTLPQVEPMDEANPHLNPSQSSTRQPTASASESPPLHPEIRSIVSLTMAHTQKIYFSGPLVRKFERQSDGHKPANDAGWRDVWVQLYGTTLSVWDMNEVKEASERGAEVPPSYINVTEAFIQVLGAVTQAATQTSPAQKYSNVITLNTAGTNLILFSCPTTADLISWAAALRLATWEKSRLEEMYTAHLIRITLNDGRNTPTPLINGRMEGWVRVRIAGQTDWKRLWLVMTSGTTSASRSPNDPAAVPSGDGRPQPAPRKKRMSALFSRERSPDEPEKPTMALFASAKAKDKKAPMLTFTAVTQAFSVYPERPKLISSSTLMKLEGTYGQEDLAGPMRFREGWMLLMPDLEGARNPGGEMLKWLIGIHDAFELYGRPKGYVWDPRSPVSMMFSYPIGPAKDLLFLDREFAEALDPREDRTPVIRANLLHIIEQRMRGIPVPTGPQSASQPPPVPGPDSLNMQSSAPHDVNQHDPLPQLPPLSFDSNANDPPSAPEKRTLTPIVERSTMDSSSWEHDVTRNPSVATRSMALAEEPRSFLDQPISQSPPPDVEGRKSFDSGRMGAGSRPDSKLDHTFVHARSNDNSSSSSVDPANFPLPPSKLDHPFTQPPSTDSASVRSVDPTNISLPTSPNPERLATSPTSTRGLTPRSNSRFSVLSSTQSQNSITNQMDSQPPRFTQQPSPAPSIHEPVSQLKTPVESIFPNPFTPATTISSLPDPYTPPKDRGVSPPRPPRRRSNMSPPLSPTPKTSVPQTVSSAPPSSPPVQAPPPAARSLDGHDISGALYYMQQENPTVAIKVGRPPIVDSESDESESASSPTTPDPPRSQPSYVPPAELAPLRPQKKMAPSGTKSPPPANSSGSKPQGARDRVNRQSLDQALSSRSTVNGTANTPQMAEVDHQKIPQASSYEDTADALAALTFLESEDSAKASSKAAENLPLPPPPPPPVHVSPPTDDYDNASENSADAQYKSSFAPSRKAAERIAKSQAQQAAHQAAVSKPGRSNGKPKTKARGAWGDSSDEEEEEENEEEEDDDDEVGSDGERTHPPPRQEQGPYPGGGIIGGNGRQPSPYGSSTDLGGLQPRGVPPRHLPQLPGGQGYGPNDGYYQGNPQRRLASSQYTDAARSQYFEEGSRRASPQPHMHQPNPAAAHQNMWSQVLEPGRGTPEKERDTFVQIEPPSHTMTKAFAPHGLLSAGLHDKQERSAKRQEELAKETGASLVNVPNKPPPPQTGLLGAVSAHERERKREGGIGAALTERERERRLAEERQRKLDDFQRQQLEMAGSMYGAPGQFGGFNPMMANPMMGMNPMMMGMNPMMMGMNPMMTGGFTNPQQMFAAQQAAQQAYQQAMMSYSQAGSQVGGDMGGMQNMQPMNPMMTGGSMFDPRMSMMGMPMMGGMMGGGMNPMGGMSPMGMQMTGGSGFDPRFSGSPSQYDLGSPPRMNLGSPAGPQPVDPEHQQRSADASPSPHQRS